MKDEEKVMAKLPIKTRILEYFIENDRPVSAGELTEVLSKEYANERHAKLSYIENQILCYCRVGMLKPVGLDETKGPECLTYQVTDYGKKEVVYIPGHGNKLF